MSKLNASDVQGFALRGYNMPFARFCFLHFADAHRARTLIARLLPFVTTGQLWDKKPQSALNLAFTHGGLTALKLPLDTLISFPPEFQLGMKARGKILGDIGLNSAEHWDEVWRTGHVHLWLAINAVDADELAARFSDVQALLKETDGATLLDTQDANAIVIDGQVTSKEHFGYTDGFGNPDYAGVCRDTQPGQG
jgi:deferrochelatase/peroxidase EfeB